MEFTRVRPIHSFVPTRALSSIKYCCAVLVLDDSQALSKLAGAHEPSSLTDILEQHLQMANCHP